MGTFDRVSPKAPILKSPAFKAAWCNSVSETVSRIQDQTARGEPAGDRRPLFNSSGLVDVKNLTGDDLLCGHYVQLGDYLYTEVNRVKHGFEGNLYDSANSGRIAIYTSVVKANKIVKARLIGNCTAVVNVTDTGHRFATPATGETIFNSSASGEVEILSDLTETGEQEVAVLLGGGSGSGVDLEVVLIDYASVVNGDGDIVGAVDDDPELVLDSSNAILSEAEFAGAVPTFFQDPIPDDPTDYTSYLLDRLRLVPYARAKYRVKVFATPTKTVLTSGTVADGTATTITLADGAPETDDYLNGATVTVSHVDGDDTISEDRPITDHEGGPPAVVTVGTAFDTTPDSSGDFTYSIWRAGPGYDAILPKLALATTSIIDNSDPEHPRKIYRYVYSDVFYDDRKTVEDAVLEEYTIDDYPGYPETESFPPDGTETYQAFEDSELRKSYRWVAIADASGNLWLITGMCEATAPPPLRLRDDA